MAVEIPLLATYGYDASEEGVHQHRLLIAGSYQLFIEEVFDIHI